jgi:signal peptidase
VAVRVRRDGELIASVVTAFARAGAHRGWLVDSLGVATVAVLLPLTVFLVSAWLLGWQLQSVQSGSMAPTYPVGSLLVTTQIDAAQVQPGMAIVFDDAKASGHLVTHRVVRIAPGETLQFVTQGDANSAPDAAPVPARLVRGRVLWQVSQLGTVLDWLQWPRSFVILVLIPGLLLVGLEWRARRSTSVAGSAVNSR